MYKSACMPTLLDYPGVTKSPTLLNGSANLPDTSSTCYHTYMYFDLFWDIFGVISHVFVVESTCTEFYYAPRF